MAKIVLIGLRGSGKSAVGRRLAERLGWPFMDTDEAVAGRAGRTIAEIFHVSGEPAFRAMEKQAVKDALAAACPAVVAAGGGAVMDPENAAAFRAAAFTIWLTAPVKTLARRVAADAATADGRPSLRGRPPAEELPELARERDPIYRAAAHWTLDTEGRGVDEAADAVLAEYDRRYGARR
jgi:shikimate kinase